jgi:hypothetical protein
VWPKCEERSVASVSEEDSQALHGAAGVCSPSSSTETREILHFF